MANNTHHYEIAVTAGRHVIVRQRIGPLAVVVADTPINAGPIMLEIRAEPKQYTFAYGAGHHAALIPMVTAPTRYLATEVTDSYTGAYFGLYATGNGSRSGAPADFDWADYQPT